MNRHIYRKLTEKQRSQISSLFSECTGDLSGPYALSLVLPNEESEEEDTFYALYYIEDSPVSFLSLFCPDGKTAEISGFTHPAFRNRGYFSVLLKEALTEAKKTFGEPEFAFQALSSDPDTAAYLRARGLSFSHSECLMVKDIPEVPAVSSGDPLSPVRIVPSSDRKLLARLHETSFTEEALPVQGYIDTVLADDQTTSYLILGEDETAVGLFHLTNDGTDRIFYFMGLGIVPTLRRKGLARASLIALFQALPGSSRLYLQVSTENEPAFRLYEGLGFQIETKLDYYR